MRILALGQQQSLIASNFVGHEVFSTEEVVQAVDVERLQPDLLVSFGYRHMLDRAILDHVMWNAVNLHISLLPWGRGADPNLWSWLEHTPKGVSIHWIDELLDKGDLLAQREVELSPALNLAQTYTMLQQAVTDLFSEFWVSLSSGAAPRTPQPATIGSYHRASEKDDHPGARPQGWQTQCSIVEEYGRRHGLWID